MTKRFWGHVAGVVAFAASVMLGGCGFFPALNSTGTTAATSNSGDYVYTVNAATDTLASFAVTNGSLTGIGSTYTLPSGYNPSAVAVSRQNTFVFTGGNGALYCYAISTSGTLSQNTAGGATAVANYRYLATSPDGQWLLALDSENLSIYVFGINSSNCALTLAQTVVWSQNQPVTSSALVAAVESIRISPLGNYVAVALGPVGDQLYTFNTTTGQLTLASYVTPASGTSDLAVQFDSSSTYLFIARGYSGSSGGAATNAVLTYPIGTAGALGTVSSVVSGNLPSSLEMDATGSYLYAANTADGTISGYTFAAGALTPLAGSPFANGGRLVQLVRDNSKKYILAAGTSGSTKASADDLTLYTIDAFTSGQLDPAAVAASGTSVGATSIAATH